MTEVDEYKDIRFDGDEDEGDEEGDEDEGDDWDDADVEEDMDEGSCS